MSALRLVPPLAPPAPTESLDDLLTERWALTDYLDILEANDPQDEGVADEYATARQRLDELDATIDQIKESKWRAWELRRMASR